jgi:hypothetical protein
VRIGHHLIGDALYQRSFPVRCAQKHVGLERQYDAVCLVAQHQDRMRDARNPICAVGRARMLVAVGKEVLAVTVVCRPLR